MQFTNMYNYQYAAVEDSQISPMSLSRQDTHPASVQLAVKNPITIGFSRQTISTHVRSTESGLRKSLSEYNHRTAFVRTRRGPTRFIVGSERTASYSEEVQQPTSTHSTISVLHHSDVFEDSEDEEDLKETPAESDDYDWEDEEIEADESHIFRRVDTPSLLTSSKSSLTSLLRSNSHELHAKAIGLSQETYPASFAEIQPDVASLAFNARECRRHMFQTELAGSLPDHVQRERHMSDKRMHATFHDICPSEEVIIAEQWHDAIDCNMWSPW